MTMPSSPPPRPDLGPDEDDLPEPPQVRRLRRLVTGLILASTLAVLAIAAALVIRVSSFGAAAPIAAERLSLPAGEAITAVGRAGAEILLTTEDGDGVERLRSFDAATGEARGVTAIERR